MMNSEENPLTTVILVGVLSFVTSMVLIVFMYVTCGRKYRLNWYEKNLLESVERGNEAAKIKSKDTKSQSESEEFWVPSTASKSKKSSSHDGESESFADAIDTTPEQSSPTLVPVARNDSMIVLSTNTPVRPKISSMQSVLDPSQIDMSLYKFESTHEVEDDNRGSVHVIILYDALAEILTVKLVEAHDLQARDFSGTADPYAKIRLLPERSNIWQTRVHKKTLNPVFDEDFVFELPPASLEKRCLEILLYDFDAYSRHHCIGGLRLPLSEIDLGEKVNVWKPLNPVFEPDARVDLGELMVSFSYLPSAERLTVVVFKARNLRVVDGTRKASDPFVKISLMEGNRTIKKRHTVLRRNTICPEFNEAFTFNVNKDTLKRCRMEFKVMHDNLLTTNEFLGKCEVGKGANGEKNLFLEVLRSKTVVSRWLPLSDY